MFFARQAFAQAIKTSYPNHLRLSIHESVAGTKLSISLLNTKTGFTTPWHCSVAQLANGEWISAPMGEFRKDDRLELVYADAGPVTLGRSHERGTLSASARAPRATSNGPNDSAPVNISVRLCHPFPSHLACPPPVLLPPPHPVRACKAAQQLHQKPTLLPLSRGAVWG